MEQCPCEECITRPICVNRCKDNVIKFILNLRSQCPILSKYLIRSESSNQLVLYDDRLVESGRILGYTITGGHHKRIEIKEDK